MQEVQEVRCYERWFLVGVRQPSKSEAVGACGVHAAPKWGRFGGQGEPGGGVRVLVSGAHHRRDKRDKREVQEGGA